MEKKPEIRVEVDPSYEEQKIIIQTNEKTELIEKIVQTVEHCIKGEIPKIKAKSKDSVVLVDQQDIIRVYTEKRRLIVCTDEGLFEARNTLRELEELLDRENFVRISRFEIVNLRRISEFDLSIAGTIEVRFDNGSSTWVARRYVRDIQQTLNRL